MRSLPKAYRRLLRVVLMVLLGLATALGLPILCAQVPTKAMPSVAQAPNAQSLLQQGLKLYQAQRYQQAVTLWQQAEREFARQGDRLAQALVLHYLSLSAQHLGQWETARNAIAKSLDLLEDSAANHNDPAYAEILAKALNTQARLQWSQGQLDAAIATWESAARQYIAADRVLGVVFSKLNQAQALQALGLNPRARAVLAEVSHVLETQPDLELKASGLVELGKAMRQVGEFQEARQVLQAGLELAERPQVQTSLWLELGNLERALGERAIALGKSSPAQSHLEQALSAYQQAALVSNSQTQLLPLLNQFSLSIAMGDWSQVPSLRSTLAEALANLPPSRSAIHARLNFAQSLTCLRPEVDLTVIPCTHSEWREKYQQQLVDNPPVAPPSWQEIAQILVTAIEQAQTLQDPSAESYALGQLGQLYELTAQWTEAQQLTQRALLRLEGIQAPEIRYRWEWQLGRLLTKQAKREGTLAEALPSAIAAYTSATETLETVRGNLLTVNPELQFSFRDYVEPVYRGLVDLLLNTEGNTQPSQANLAQAITAIDALHFAELENYLGCSLTSFLRPDQGLNPIDPKAALIYPILLPERLGIIAQLPGQPLSYYQQPVSQPTVETTLQNLRRAAIRRDASSAIENGKTVYRWLLAPLEEDLARNSEVNTLVFIPDGYLRNVPLTLLYDAKNDEYLAEKKYALALLPNLRLFDLESKSKQIGVLGAGISQELSVAGAHFKPLNTTIELQQIQQTVAKSTILLNSAFTKANLQKHLQSGDFSIVHMATHGNFSSDPNETYILAYDAANNTGQLLNPQDLDNLLRLSGREQATFTPLEILVLSACQTASGDNRAPLGLAGVAVRSGARSTLATLWQVSDLSTVELMEEFYKQLNQPGVTKAQALHRAQQSLLETVGFQNPFYWAPYVLVGNWL